MARSFDQLLADLREKRDMETYVTELSRNLPEPSQGKAVVGSPQTRDVLLMGIELRRFARPVNGAGPQATLDLLAIDLARVSEAVSANRGQSEGVVGHRVLARFEGASRGRRALTAAAQILGDTNEESESDAPVVAMAPAGPGTVSPVQFAASFHWPLKPPSQERNAAPALAGKTRKRAEAMSSAVRGIECEYLHQRADTSTGGHLHPRG